MTDPMPIPTQCPNDEETIKSDAPPPAPDRAPETEHVEEEGDPLGANFA